MSRFKIQDIIKAVTPSTVRDSDIQNMHPNIEAFVHCECALAVSMRQFTSTFESLEIGVSKDCCWPCTVFLMKEYAKETGGGGISLSASHGKTYRSWLFPLPLEESHGI